MAGQEVQANQTSTGLSIWKLSETTETENTKKKGTERAKMQGTLFLESILDELLLACTFDRERSVMNNTESKNFEARTPGTIFL